MLIVDDNRELAVTMATVVREFCPSFSVVDVAFDGRQGLAMALSYPPDVIIMDMEMPVMNGLQCAAAILSVCGDRPLMLIAASGSRPMLELAKRSGAFQHVCVKPVPLQWLLDRLG